MTEELLLNYGVAGVFLVLLVGFAHSTVKRLVKDRDEAVADTKALTQDVFTNFAPTLERVTHVIDSFADRDEEIQSVLVDVRRLLERQQ